MSHTHGYKVMVQLNLVFVVLGPSDLTSGFVVALAMAQVLTWQVPMALLTRVAPVPLIALQAAGAVIQLRSSI